MGRRDYKRDKLVFATARDGSKADECSQIVPPLFLPQTDDFPVIFLCFNKTTSVQWNNSFVASKQFIFLQLSVTPGNLWIRSLMTQDTSWIHRSSGLPNWMSQNTSIGYLFQLLQVTVAQIMDCTCTVTYKTSLSPHFWGVDRRFHSTSRTKLYNPEEDGSLKAALGPG